MTRKFFLFLTLTMVLFTVGCANKDVAAQPTVTTEVEEGKILCAINKLKKDENWEHAPNLAYNEDGSFKKDVEVFAAMFGTKSNAGIADVSFELIHPGTKQIKINTEGISVFIPDYDAFDEYASGYLVDKMRLWVVFVDRNNEIWYWEYIGKKGIPYGLNISYPGPYQELTVIIAATHNQWKPGIHTINFILSTTPYDE
ncbi:MAG: hypothetical protein ACOX0Z_01215 [Candidatus Nanosyncoccaceae bacterium]|jgi:hypothetical protein